MAILVFLCTSIHCKKEVYVRSEEEVSHVQVPSLPSVLYSASKSSLMVALLALCFQKTLPTIGAVTQALGTLFGSNVLEKLTKQIDKNQYISSLFVIVQYYFLALALRIILTFYRPINFFTFFTIPLMSGLSLSFKKFYYLIHATFFTAAASWSIFLAPPLSPINEIVVYSTMVTFAFFIKDILDEYTLIQIQKKSKPLHDKKYPLTGLPFPSTPKNHKSSRHLTSLFYVGHILYLLASFYIILTTPYMPRNICPLGLVRILTPETFTINAFLIKTILSLLKIFWRPQEPKLCFQ